MKIELLVDISHWERRIVITCKCGHTSEQHRLSIEDDVIAGTVVNGCTLCNCQYVFDPSWNPVEIHLKED